MAKGRIINSEYDQYLNKMEAASNAYGTFFVKNVHRCLYVLQAVGSDYVKIGITINMVKRIDKLKTGCPFPLKCILLMSGNSRSELMIKKRFVEYKKHGEWYEYKGELKHFIEYVIHSNWNLVGAEE